MGTLATINGIDEDDIATHNGVTASLYTNYNGDTWGHYAFGGTAYGYSMGNGNVIEKYPYASDGDANDVGDMTSSRNQADAGGRSSTHGYVCGTAYDERIDKFPFASDTNATNVGNTPNGRSTLASASSASYTYQMGGWSSPGGYDNYIDKFSHASDGTAADVGTLAIAVGTQAGQSSATYGYNSGGDG